MTDTRRGQAFLTGLFGGALLGAAAGALFAPQIYAALKTLRGELTDAVSDAGDAATSAYQDASTRAGAAVEDLQGKGRDAYGKVLSVIIKGAEDVEDRVIDAKTALDKSAAKAAARRS